MFSKRGQAIFNFVILGIIALFVVAIAWQMIFNNQGFAQAVDYVTTGTIDSVGPFFRILLGSSGDPNQDFLAILAFFLVAIVVVSTLDSVNMFGGPGKMNGGHLVNLFVGLIVAIIGVRFMPNNLWQSLTTPSSALVATVLVGLPFLALFFMTMKIKYPLANKIIWLVYFAFMSYLVATVSFGASSSDTRNWVYIIFSFFGLVMLLFDAQIRKIIYKERAQAAIASAKGGAALRQIHDLKVKLEEYQKVVADDTSTDAEVEEAERRIDKIESTIKKLAGYK